MVQLTAYLVGAGRLAPLFLFMGSIYAQVITLGSSGGTVQATDACFSGGQIFTTVPITPPGTSGALRYGAQFTCTIPISTSIPWLVTFHFVEPCSPGGGCSTTITAPGQRLFDVTINDTPALVDMDIFSYVGSLGWLQRSVLVWPSSSNSLRIKFTASMRTAIVSSIDYSTVALPQMWQNKVAILLNDQGMPDTIMGSDLVHPQVLLGLNAFPDGHTEPVFSFHETRPIGHLAPPDQRGLGGEPLCGFNAAANNECWIPDFDCSRPPADAPGERDPTTGHLLDCITSGLDVKKR